MRLFRPLMVIALLLAVPAAGLRGFGIALVLTVVNELAVLAADLHGERARSKSRLGPLARTVWRWIGRLLGWLSDRLGRRQHSSQSATFPAYERVIGDLAWARHSRRDFDMTLRKRLLDAAAVRLEHEHGVVLDRQPERARRLLGEPAWSVLAPGRPASVDRNAPGVTTAEVDRVVRAIEELGSGPGRDWGGR